jgi:putative ABC transport system substrate-binding protein
VRLIGGLVAVLIALPVTGLAQPAVPATPTTKVYRIGWLELGGGTADSAAAALDAEFRQAMRERGYVEGQNLVIERRLAGMTAERLPALADELVRLRVDAIVALTTSPVRAARQATSTVPIVMLLVSDPVGTGLVRSLGHPGGNVTGLSFFMTDLIGKQLELLKEIVPAMARIGVLRDPAATGHRLMLERARTLLPALGLQLTVADAATPAQLESAFAAMARAAAQGLVVPAHPLYARERVRLAELAARHRLPAMYGATDHARAGGLVAYAPSLADSYRRGAYYVDRVLKGARPADLPVEQPTRLELVVNLRTARALGLTVPPSVLVRADQVIE